MDKNQIFLERYELLKTNIYKNYKCSIEEYENQLKPVNGSKEKYKICRLFKKDFLNCNYDFVNISDKMINFINDEINRINESQTLVQNNMFTLDKAIKETDLLIIAADWMCKNKTHIVPVFNDKDFATGALSYADIVKYISTGNFTKAKKVINVQSAYKFKFIKYNATMLEAEPLLAEHDKIFLVLDDSKKVIGWII